MGTICISVPRIPHSVGTRTSRTTVICAHGRGEIRILYSISHTALKHLSNSQPHCNFNKCNIWLH